MISSREICTWFQRFRFGTFGPVRLLYPNFEGPSRARARARPYIAGRSQLNSAGTMSRCLLGESRISKIDRNKAGIAGWPAERKAGSRRVRSFFQFCQSTARACARETVLSVSGANGGLSCSKPAGEVPQLSRQPSWTRSRSNPDGDLVTSSALFPEDPHKRKAAQQGPGRPFRAATVTARASPKRGRRRSGRGVP